MPLVYRTAANAAFTRPADTTAYTSGDLVANSTTAGSVVPLTFALKSGASSCRISRALLTKSTSTIANASFRLHLFATSPAVAAGDNSAIAPTALASYGYLGSLSGSTVLGGGTTGAVVQLAPDAGDIWGLAGTMYGLIEARAAYAPGNAETFTAELTYVLES
jgi:hypothetical protein